MSRKILSGRATVVAKVSISWQSSAYEGASWLLMDGHTTDKLGKPEQPAGTSLPLSGGLNLQISDRSSASFRQHSASRAMSADAPAGGPQRPSTASSSRPRTSTSASAMSALLCASPHTSAAISATSKPPGTSTPPPECNRHIDVNTQIAPRASASSLSSTPSLLHLRCSKPSAGSKNFSAKAGKVIGHKMFCSADVSRSISCAARSDEDFRTSKSWHKSAPAPWDKWSPTVMRKPPARARAPSFKSVFCELKVLKPWNCAPKSRQTETHSAPTWAEPDRASMKLLSMPSKIDLCAP
mmetsp:Transcript_87456/g.220731  ORF Transcript_87456/g.220731 Transcript_87456/m.220731 type:complete len:297 (+) Transcript_87456:914-1804(+)